MSTTPDIPPRRARRILTAWMLLPLLVLSGGLVVFGPAEPAHAVDVTIDDPIEPIPIDDQNWPFTGQADPGDEIEVQALPDGEICETVTPLSGLWACDVNFPRSGPLVQVKATRAPKAGPFLDSEQQEYYVALPPQIQENTDSGFISNEGADPVVYGSATPGSTVYGTIGGTACSTVVPPSGDFACEATGAGYIAEIGYAVTLRENPVGVSFDSQPSSTTYYLDSSVTVPDSSTPWDTGAAGGNFQTSDPTPLITGNPGDAEDSSDVIVYAYRYSTNNVVPAWPAAPPPAFNPFDPYCTAESTSNGAWSCSGNSAHRMRPGEVWVIGLSQVDLAGNGPPSPDSEFSIQILPPPPAPTILAPVLGYASLNDHTVHVSTTNLPVGVMFVREGNTNLCPSTPLAAATFSCNTAALSNGYHTISIWQTDQFGTASAIAKRIVHIGPYPISLSALDFTFRIIGPDGVEVGVDGLNAGDAIRIEASGLPPGAIISAEIHSTPKDLGSTTIGPSGRLALATVIPEIEPGDHEIVVSAQAVGFEPSTKSNTLSVREKKDFGTAPVEEIKDMGPLEPGSGDEGIGGDSGGGSPAGHGFGDPTIFGSSVEDPFNTPAHEFALSPAGIVLSGTIAIAFLLLVGFPAELLESTIRSNYDRAFGWLARLRRRVGQLVAPVARLLARPWVGVGLSVAAAAFILGFADPDYGFNGASVRLFLAMVIAVVTINIGLSLIVMRVARRAFDVRAFLKPMPAALAIVALSVLVSRFAGISPGFLFGVVLGIAYARELRLRDDARLGVLGVGLTIAAGVLAWLGYGLASLASGPGFFNNLLIETLAAITLEALGTLVIALLPIEFMDGRTIFRWSKLAWLGLYVLTVLVFLFVVVPLSDNWGTMSAPALGWGTLFAVFAVVAIVTWAVFRRRATTSSPENAAPQRRSRR